MKDLSTHISGVKIIEPDVLRDARTFVRKGDGDVHIDNQEICGTLTAGTITNLYGVMRKASLEDD